MDAGQPAKAWTTTDVVARHLAAQLRKDRGAAA